MRKGGDGAIAAKPHEVIDRQVSQMARLIDDLLDLSRINRGLIELQTQHVLVADLLHQGVATAAPAIDAAGHQLDVQLPDEELWVAADPARMVQVIGNLLTNAAKYTPDRGQIRLSARCEGASVVITVADNGIGIPLEHQGKLFQMFTQLPHTAARTQGGLGIGLALVRTLVEMHGGTVGVASGGLDEGSTFTVELPVLQTVTAAEGGDAPAFVAPAGVTGTRVLVVEDNKDGLATLMALLETIGYSVAGAPDGLQAIELARRFVPDVVLLDLGLPGLDGFGVAKAIRGDAQLRHVFMVALTGWGAEQDRARTAEAGFDAHLTKPVEPDALESFLGEFVASRSRATSAR